MGTFRSLLLAGQSLVLFVSASAAEPSIRQETIAGSDGSAWTRTIRSCDVTESSGRIATSLRGSRGANQYLWLDRNHQDAIAEHVAITGDGEYGVAGWWLNNTRASLYRVPGGTGNADWVHPMPLADLQIAVDADFLGDRLTSAARGESLFVLGADSPAPIFSDWFSTPYLGIKCAVSDGGTTFAGAAGDPSGVGGELRVHDGTTGALRFVRPLLAQPEGLCVSGDGTIVAANVRGFVKIWNAVTGVLRDSVAIPGETQTPAVLSRDGGYLATGGFGRTVRLYHWNGADYVEDWANTIPNTTWVTALAISRDASTIVAGTWTNATGGRVVAYDRTSSTPIWTDASFGDEVQSVAVTPDGRKIAAGSWGRLGGTAGNVISVYERSSPIPLWTVGDDAVAGVGSCMSVDLSESGRLLFAGGKAVHAREFGSGGFVIAIDVTSAAGVPDTDGAPALTAGPNPFRGSLRVYGAGERVTIWSADGRLIRSVIGSRWDGRDEAGRDVSAGIYFVRAGAPGNPPLRVVRIR